MSQLAGNLSEEAAASVVARVFRERRTGVLSLRNREEDTEERWSFVSGELYLPGEHRLVSAYRSLSGSDPKDAGSSAGGFSWVELAAAALGRWTEGEYLLEDGPGGIAADLHGPLPTASLVMHAAVHGRNEFELLRMLDGDEGVYVASKNASDLDAELDPHEAFFLSRLEQPAPVKELLRQASLDRQTALEKLCRLLAVDLIQPHDRDRVALSTPGSGLLSPKMLENFSGRISSSLAEEPLKLEAQEHRNKVAALLASLGTMTYYELLEVKLDTSPDEVHSTYERLARVVHPQHAVALGLQGKEAGLELLFEKATEAYLTLSDESRSQGYREEIGADGSSMALSPEVRQQELDELAEQNYKQARALEQRGDFHFAIELVQQAIRTSPKAEYLALLGRCQAQNPQWLHKALAAFAQALELEPDNAELHVELARAFEALGREGDARREFERALASSPGQPEALAGLNRLSGGAGRRSASQPASSDPATGKLGSWLRRLLGR